MRKVTSPVVGASGPLSAFGPGKVILLGEHSVVFGYPALAGSLSWGVTARAVPSGKIALRPPAEVTGAGRKQLLAAFARAARVTGEPKVRVFLESDLPASMGLGSSAAVSVAISRLLLQVAGRASSYDDVVRLALEMEQEFHGTPSGVDHTCSARQALIFYRKQPLEEVGRARTVASPQPLHILVAIAGERSPTKKTVGALRERQARWPIRYKRLFAEIGKAVMEGTRAVEVGDLDALGDAMNVNQGLLSALQLSSSRLDEMVYRLRDLGALGAKLTGAGGDGGAVVGLFRDPLPAVAKLTALGIRCFSSQLAGPRET